MNQVYKKEEFLVIPVSNNFIIININKQFKQGHTHVKKIEIARLLIDLAINKKLPKNPYYVENLNRITNDKDYIDKLKEFKENASIDYKELMKHDGYKRVRGAMRQVKRE